MAVLRHVGRLHGHAPEASTAPPDASRASWWRGHAATAPRGLWRGGAGSTLLAADQLQFNAIGIEQDATYAEDARRKFTRDAGLFAEIG